MLSQDMTVKGVVPASRRFLRPSAMRPNTVVRIIRMLAVAGDLRELRIELAGGGIDEIAALGDGDRDDADRRIGKLADDGGAVLRRDHAEHGARDAGAADARLLLHHGGEPVLRLERVMHGAVGGP